MSKTNSKSLGGKSLRDFIIECDDIQTEDVPVKEWGGIVLNIRGMSGAARAEFINGARTEEGALDFASMYPALIVATAFDPDSGEQVFTQEDANALNAKSGAALERVCRVSMRLSGMTEESEKELGKDSSPESDASTSS